MTAPRVDQTPPNESWARMLHTPFLRDTVLPLLRTPPTLRQGNPRWWTDSYPGRRAAGTVADTVWFYRPKADQHALLHEIGHVLDNQAVAPDVTTAVDRHPAQAGTYAATSHQEHVAEAFARALESSRRGFSDSTRAERDSPGAIEFIRWLQTQRPFARDSLAKDVGRVLGAPR